MLSADICVKGDHELEGKHLPTKLHQPAGRALPVAQAHREGTGELANERLALPDVVGVRGGKRQGREGSEEERRVITRGEVESRGRLGSSGGFKTGLDER